MKGGLFSTPEGFILQISEDDFSDFIQMIKSSNPTRYVRNLKDEMRREGLGVMK